VGRGSPRAAPGDLASRGRGRAMFMRCPGGRIAPHPRRLAPAQPRRPAPLAGRPPPPATPRPVPRQDARPHHPSVVVSNSARPQPSPRHPVARHRAAPGPRSARRCATKSRPSVAPSRPRLSPFPPGISLTSRWSTTRIDDGEGGRALVACRRQQRGVVRRVTSAHHAQRRGPMLILPRTPMLILPRTPMLILPRTPTPPPLGLR